MNFEVEILEIIQPNEFKYVLKSDKKEVQKFRLLDVKPFKTKINRRTLENRNRSTTKWSEEAWTKVQSIISCSSKIDIEQIDYVEENGEIIGLGKVFVFGDVEEMKTKCKITFKESCFDLGRCLIKLNLATTFQDEFKIQSEEVQKSTNSFEEVEINPDHLNFLSEKKSKSSILVQKLQEKKKIHPEKTLFENRIQSAQEIIVHRDPVSRKCKPIQSLKDIKDLRHEYILNLERLDMLQPKHNIQSCKQKIFH